jgi:hypothetical protein
MMIFELPVNAKKHYKHVFEGSVCLALFRKHDSFLTRYILCSIDGEVIGGICYYPTLKIGKKILSGKEFDDWAPLDILKHPKINWVRSSIMDETLHDDVKREVEERLLATSLKFARDNKIDFFLPYKFAPKRDRIYVT